MSYIVRFFKWVIGGIIHLAKEIIMFTIRQIISIIRFALPYVLRGIVICLGIAFSMSLLNLLALVRPVPEVAKKKGEEWAKNLVEIGYGPSLHELTFVKIFTVVAFIAINVGFFINLFTAVFITVWFWENGDWLISLVR